MIAAMATAFPEPDRRPVRRFDRPHPRYQSLERRDIVGEFARGTPADVEQAVASAKQAFAKWSLSTPQERFDILDRAGTEILARKEELGRLLSREQGKPLADGMGEAGRAGAIFKYFAGEAVRIRGDKLDSVRPGVEVEVTREPVGVVGIITPWNFPLAIPAWKIAPALAFGNCVVFKPAELAPASPWTLVDIIQRAGLPAGVLNLVMGPGSKIGPALTSSPDVDAVSFTGSQDIGVGIGVAAVKNGTRVQLEMGGKNPLIVLDDADLATAVSVAVNGAYFQTGQRCTASSRLIVTEGIHDRFIAAMIERMKRLVVDDALKPGTEIGPVVDDKQLGKNLEYVEIGQKEGATLAYGGERLTRETDGYYMAPAIFTETARVDADQSRRDLRARRVGHQGEELRRSAGVRERHAVRPVGRHRDDVAQACEPLQAPLAERARHGESPDGRSRLPRPVRRAEEVELRPARAGRVREGVLHDREDHLHRALIGAQLAVAGCAGVATSPNFRR